MEVWQSVKVKNENHPRHGEAGVVHATDKDHPDEVAVRFDADQQVQLVDVADLQAL